VETILLGAAEREEGLRATFLFPAHMLDRERLAVAMQTLTRTGHWIGTWIPPELAARSGDAAALVSTFKEALHVETQATVEVIGMGRAHVAEGADESAAAELLSKLCDETDVSCWIAGAACGRAEIVRPEFHVYDTPLGWTLDSTTPEYTVASVSFDALAQRLLPLLCESTARACCMYTLSSEFYR
jgi:hypothetical protein